MAEMLGTQRVDIPPVDTALIDHRLVDGQLVGAQTSGAGRWSARFASLTGLRHARLDPERDGVRALAAAALAAVLVSGALAWWSRPIIEAPARAPTPLVSASP